MMIVISSELSVYRSGVRLWFAWATSSVCAERGSRCGVGCFFVEILRLKFVT